MNNNRTVIEITPVSLRVLTGTVKEQSVYVIDSVETGKIGKENGYFIEREFVLELQQALNKIRKDTAVDLGPYIVLYPPIGFSIGTDRGDIYLGDEQNGVRRSDYESCIARAKDKCRNLNDGRHLLNCAPFQFATNLQQGLNLFPLGTSAKQIAVDFDLHFISDDYYKVMHDMIYKALGMNPHLELISTYAHSSYLKLSGLMDEYLLADLDWDYTYVSHVKQNRIVASSKIDLGIKDIIDKCANRLKVSQERCKELIETYNFTDNPHFMFRTEEGLDLKDTCKVFCEEFQALAQALYDSISDWNVDENVSLLLSGYGSTIENIDGLFARLLARNCAEVDRKVLGLTKGTFDSLLGAIYLSSLKYQPTMEQAKKKMETMKFGGVGFDR